MQTGIFGMIVVAMLGGVSIGIAIGHSMGRAKYQQQAIERGYAEHNAVTGEWQWKETKGQSDED